MNWSSQSGYSPSLTYRNDPPLNATASWADDITNYPGDYAAQQGYASDQPDDPSGWNTVTAFDPFSNQRGGVPGGTWLNLQEPLIEEDSCMSNAVEDPFSAIVESESSWLPAAYTLDLCTSSLGQNAENNQAGEEEPWSRDPPNTSSGADAEFTYLDENMFNYQPAADSLPVNRSEDSDAAIGTVLKNGTFKCSMIQCATRSFKRPAELKRHYNTTHAAQKLEFWCGVLFCHRSAGIGGRPFLRKYRLHDHMRKVHGREVEGGGDDDEADD